MTEIAVCLLYHTSGINRNSKTIGLLENLGCYWLLCPPVCDVVTMGIQADMEGILCVSHVLLMTLPHYYSNLARSLKQRASHCRTVT